MLRSVISVTMNMAGMAVVFASMVMPQVSANLQLQVILVLIGVLMIQGAVWKFTNPFLPSERRYDELRHEVDDFIDLVRELNEAGVEVRRSGSPAASEEIERVAAVMHRSVDQMARLAGKEISFAYLPEPLDAVELDALQSPRQRSSQPSPGSGNEPVPSR